MKSLMVIPVIRTCSWHTWEAITHYSYRPDEIRVITNSDIELEGKHIPQGGSRKLVYAMQRFNPDVLIYHASDWELLDNDALKIMMSHLDDPQVISVGLHPYTKNGGSWHLCSKDETPHGVMYISAHKREIYPYVEKVMNVMPTSEIWNEAMYLATVEGWEVRPLYLRAQNNGMH